ncbi:hypothetical protein ASE86_11655 [Sphingomonas sp. Leaf33]|uniref:hypothetical protein n=1 Tax=Sphingomonas sp. Leaf33 TaxID=1736215 RepID=UPI0006F625E6|nr:hypothetical protein [Sphingomonas sp. Leaf33]KQN26710.1 hypothetical protein ASE86_11655 [Sphingomonas sp. Leaf33]
MTLRPLLAAVALLAAPAALAADPSSPATQTADGAARSDGPTRGAMPRKADRKQPGVPSRSRIMDAPGVALMMIPAAWDPEMPSGFHR